MMCFTGDRLSDDDVDQLLQGQEDAQGNINYEGIVLYECMTLEKTSDNSYIQFE